MSLFDQHMSQGSGTMPVDDDSNKNGPPTAAPDGLVSPPDGISNHSSSVGSPDSPDGMDCDHGDWPESGVESAGK